MSNSPYIWGAQYYRAPTPEHRFWEKDFQNMKKIGFTDIKFWVQWRWCHRGENIFFFDDLDELMDLAYKYQLRVTLNIICDVIPSWILDKYPDCMQTKADGTPVQPYVSVCRQIGGMPGPCYRHPEAFKQRKIFIEEVVKHYVNHPALFMWDIWNEPEQCHRYRHPQENTLVCYCNHCRNAFLAWLQNKYHTIDKCNEVWGRCYSSWEQIELPRTTDTISDFIDYREFNLETMTDEASWRIGTVKKYDHMHKVYLHVVPNTSSIFNSVTCVDDYSLADRCDVFASTNFSKPIWSILTLSAANGKTSYNAECHIGNGSTAMHQKIIKLSDMVRDLVPQLGLGIRGFMFWQYHAETLGMESPAWGCTKPNGELSSVGVAAEQFMKLINPFLSEIICADVAQPQVAVLKDIKNEIFQFCVHGGLKDYAQAIETYVNFCYTHSIPCCILSSQQLVKIKERNVKLLIMPMCYAMDSDTAKVISEYVHDGGVLLCEAHLAGYEIDRGRHADQMPGCNLADLWNISEEWTTASYHLEWKSHQDMLCQIQNDDVKKAMDNYGMEGGKFFPINIENEYSLWGADRFASLKAENCAILGTYEDNAVIIQKQFGRGHIFYCGTNISSAAICSPDSFDRFLSTICDLVDIVHNNRIPVGVHFDRINSHLFVLVNNNDQEQQVSWPNEVHGIFGIANQVNKEITLPPFSAELFTEYQGQ